MKALFCCPVCRAPLFDKGTGAACANGHCFDRAAEGYLHLLPSNKMRAKVPGDNREMVAARRAFLDTGYYRVFQDGIAKTAVRLLAGRPHPVVLDAGCGEGSYTAAVEKALRDDGNLPFTAGFDISKAAIRSAARRYPQIAFAVAGSFDIPMADQSCDLLFSVFAPIVPQEFMRVIKAGGYLLLAVPGAKHLFGLKEILYDRPYQNEPKDIQYEGFSFLERISLRDRLLLKDAAQIWNLFMMTPYYWKTPVGGTERLKTCAKLETELAFDLLIYRRNG